MKVGGLPAATRQRKMMPLLKHPQQVDLTYFCTEAVRQIPLQGMHYMP